MKLSEKIKTFLGLEKRTPYVNEYFDKSNIRSSLYVSSVVILLELFMIANITLRQFNAETRRTSQWFIIHISCFIILLLAALVLFIYSLRHIKKISTNRTLWNAFKYVSNWKPIGHNTTFAWSTASFEETEADKI